MYPTPGTRGSYSLHGTTGHPDVARTGSSTATFRTGPEVGVPDTRHRSTSAATKHADSSTAGRRPELLSTTGNGLTPNGRVDSKPAGTLNGGLAHSQSNNHKTTHDGSSRFRFGNGTASPPASGSRSTVVVRSGSAAADAGSPTSTRNHRQSNQDVNGASRPLFRQRAAVDGLTSGTAVVANGLHHGSVDEVSELVDHPFFALVNGHDENALQIVSSKGTVRGVRNRVKAGIAAFVDKNDGKKRKDYRTLEKGKVVLYTTSVMVVRDTYDKCLRIKKILQTHMVRYEERDVSISRDDHRELVERIGVSDLPQVFADGLHIGGADDVERLNENGTLRRIFHHFQTAPSTPVCVRCGGYRYTPCTNCHGSKKSRRNNFTVEFCALRCTVCDDNGLVMCDLCANDETSSAL